jgi:hypothetical protein
LQGLLSHLRIIRSLWKTMGEKKLVKPLWIENYKVMKRKQPRKLMAVFKK